MKRYLMIVFCGLVGGSNAPDANAQAIPAQVQMHAAKGKAAAYEPGQPDLTHFYDLMCRPALVGRAAAAGPEPPPAAEHEPRPRASWYMEPVKVFDNLYYIGSQTDSMWAVSTSNGIILVDAGYADTIRDLSDGLRKFGLDPAQIKFVIVSHAHEDRYAGTRYLQDTFGTKVVMSGIDWSVLEKSRVAPNLKPRKDVEATDGMKLTLGDTTVTMYVTPAHTPGGLSTILPLKDGDRRHVGVVGGGMVPFPQGEGVTYYASVAESLTAHRDALKRFRQIAATAGVDTFLFTNPHYDLGLEKLHVLSFREPGEPHPFVSRNAVERYFTVMTECTDAQLARGTGER